MVMQKVRMHAKTIDDEYVQVLPETVSSQVITDLETGQTLEDMILSGTLGGGGKISRAEFVVSVDIEGQTEFSFNEPAFDDSLDIVEVHLNGEFLHKNEEYTVVKNGNELPKVVLTQTTSIGDKVHITVEKLTSGSGGSSLTDEQADIIDSISSHDTIYIDPVNGSDDNIGTVDAPFKTAKAASEYINSKNFIDARVTIALKTGTYVNDCINVRNVNMLVITTVDGEVVFEGTPLINNGGLFSNMFFDHIGRVKLGGTDIITLKPNPETTMSTALYYPIYFNYVSSGYAAPTVIVDGVNSDSSKAYQPTVKTGIVIGYSSNVELRVTIRNMTRSVYVVNNSRAVINQASIEQGQIYAIIGSIISKGSSQVVDNAEYLYDASSVFLNQVSNGIIVETDTNENGRYTKFSSGLIIMQKVVPIEVTQANTLTSVVITLPISNVSIDSTLLNVREISSNPNYTLSRLTAENVYDNGVIDHRVVRIQPSVAQLYAIDVLFIGRWK